MTGRAWADADATQRVAAARAQIGVTVEYDPAYTKLAYPGGDVPLKTGVCCDVVIRALRKQGRDLQQLVHEDMRKHFVLYPQKWGLQKPDANIDHRRGLNLACYFQRQGWSVGISTQPAAYLPGDIVTWDLGHGLTHIGIVSDRQSVQATPLVIHNIGRGAREEDLLFRFTITGHYRPSKTENPAPPAAAPARAGPHVLRSESTAAPGGSK
ncbi:MAG: DUF1287 domain-containing protein [Kiritimatiellaeota bacterium]|nr:DUF1287 domain-containing protein [Kiritimatiellota bacterium]